MIGLVEAVRSEHREILDLLDRLERTAVRLPQGERRTVRALIALESRHEMAEAQVLWPAVRDVLRDLSAARAVAQGQERDGRRLLHRLYKAVGTEAAGSLLPRAVELVRLHIALEESQILAPLESELSRNDSMSLGGVFELISAKSPTRPHPLTPAIPGLLALTGPFARRADRLRDLLHLG